MSQATTRNIDSSSVFDAVTNRIKRYKSQGIIFLIIGFSLFFLSILLGASVSPFLFLLAIPMPFFLFFGFRMTTVATATGATGAYKKIRDLLSSKNISALQNFTNLSFKDDLMNFQPENYFQRLFSIAALLDLNAPNSKKQAIEFYRKVVDEKIKPDEAKTLLEALARKEGKQSYIEYLN